MENKKKQAGEVLRFVITGGVCFAVEFVALVLLKNLLHLDTLIAVPIAFTVSVIVNYILCVAWVFQGTKDAGNAQRIGFLVTSVMGLLLNEGLMMLFRSLFGEETILFTIFGFSVKMYMVNKVLATLLVMVWNYFTKRAMLRRNWDK
ncbi:MAG: GtrA family protein [Clostridia bacterium]|nr:GtrA family protein [Clostridia bacterium]